jgi:hypothetical protein
VTITVGRLAAWVAGVATLIAVTFLALHVLKSSNGVTSFQAKASKICREEIPKFKSAPDLPTALNVSVEMRQRLGALTPPADKANAFTQYLAVLKASEDAVRAGDMNRAVELDPVARVDATTLGIDGACTTRG